MRTYIMALSLIVLGVIFNKSDFVNTPSVLIATLSFGACIAVWQDIKELNK